VLRFGIGEFGAEVAPMSRFLADATYRFPVTTVTVAKPGESGKSFCPMFVTWTALIASVQSRTGATFTLRSWRFCHVCLEDGMMSRLLARGERAASVPVAQRWVLVGSLGRGSTHVCGPTAITQADL